MHTPIQLPAFLPALLATAGFIVLALAWYYRFRISGKTGTYMPVLTDTLKELQRNSRLQYSLAAQYLASFPKHTNQETSSFLSSLSLPPSMAHPHACLALLITAFKNHRHVKTCTRFFSLRDEIRYRYSSLMEYASYYASEVQLNEKLYYDNLFELSKVHDELAKYMMVRNADKSNGAEWYETYLSIFSSWFRSGGNRNLETTYQDIVVKIIELNTVYRYAPFTFQTSACVQNCDSAYNNICTLHKNLETKIVQYAFYYKLCYRMVRLVLQKLEPAHKPASPAASITPPAILQGDAIIPGVAGKASLVASGGKTGRLRHILYAGCTALLLLVAMAVYFTWRPAGGINSQVPALKTAGRDTAPANALQLGMTGPLHEFAAGPGYDSLDFKILFDSCSKARSYVYGIDISRYQGNLLREFKSLDTLHFLICKATEGATAIDADFSSNWNFIKQQEYIRGAYHFFHSDDPAVKQADLFLRTVEGLRSTDMPPIIDVEEGSLKGNTNASVLDSALIRLLQYLQAKTHRTPIIYSNLAFANQYLLDSSLSDYPLWLAEYSDREIPVVPKTWKEKGYVIWQRSDSYHIGSRKTDFDVFNGDGRALVDFITGHAKEARK